MILTCFLHYSNFDNEIIIIIQYWIFEHKLSSVYYIHDIVLWCK